jgi:hypothetical protein
MVKGAIPTAKEDQSIEEKALSCTFCGPGTWSTWEIVTDDCVVFACDRHHAEMSQTKIIRLERMKGKESWDKICVPRDVFYEEENFDDIDDYE